MLTVDGMLSIATNQMEELYVSKHYINMWLLLHVQYNHLIYFLQLMKRTVCWTTQAKHSTPATASVPIHMEREREHKPVREDGLHNRQVSMASICMPNLVCVHDSIFSIYVEASL